MSSIEYRVCTKITQRAQVGKEKYGTTMDRKDLTKLQWLKACARRSNGLSCVSRKNNPRRRK